MADPAWVPFLGLTAVVLVLLLVLARASQRVVDDGHPVGHGSEPRPRPATGRVTNGTLERHAVAEGKRQFVPTGEVPDSEMGRPVETGARSPELTPGLLLVNVALTQGLFGGVLVVGALFYQIPAGAIGVTGEPWVGGIPALLVGVVFGVALWGVNEASAAVADAVGAAYDEGLRKQLAPDTRVGWVLLLGGVLPVIAVVEELLFRAAVIGVPAAGFDISPWALAIVASGAFALGHGAQGRAGVALTGSLGFVLAAGYILSGSLLVVVVAHYLVNALEFLVHEWLGLDRVL